MAEMMAKMKLDESPSPRGSMIAVLGFRSNWSECCS
jgi:hypothetical protein